MEKFPSPHGDKFQRTCNSGKISDVRFRPLTGINFNRMSSSMPWGEAFPFPSPHGVKFQREIMDIWKNIGLFPSPHGDKFQRKSDENA